jgi:transcriptional regulator with XRE-family HTH domain
MVKSRKSAGLTQRELAKLLHKPQSFAAKYEGGERRVDVVEFLTICNAIGADPTKLNEGADKRSQLARSHQEFYSFYKQRA